MSLNIYQFEQLLIKKLIIFTFFILSASCNAQNITSRFITKSKEVIFLEISSTDQEKQKGLSGRKEKSFPLNRGMLFIYKNSSPKKFWMPDTYFNLDIFFMNKNFKITHIERNVPHHPGYKEPPKIYRTKPYKARYVLEMNSKSKIAKTLEIGEQLKLISPNFSLETK